jgi:hypothetical protein
VWGPCTRPECLRRWLLPISGDLRLGGTFSFKGNAGGTILRCEPPRLIKVTWAYEDRAVDEIEVRLSAAGHDSTVLGIEQATVTGLVEWEGQMPDVILGVGAGWEVPLTYSPPMFLRGETPDAPSSEWYQPKAEVAEIEKRSEAAWKALVAADARQRRSS